MKTILFVALIAIMTAGFAAADPADMSIYDINDDGMIDATERIALDIDIENARVTNDEAYVIDSYTVDGTIILNDEFQNAFLNLEPRNTDVEVIVIPDPVEEPAPVIPAEPEPEPVTVETTEPVDEPNNSLVFIFVVCMIVIAVVIIYLYNKQNQE